MLSLSHVKCVAFFDAIELMKNILPNIVIVSVLGFLLTSCNSFINKESSKNEVKKFFDLKGLVANISDKMDSQVITVQKTINMNGEEESISGDSINWQEELKFIMDFDINKTILYDKYDSLQEGNTLSYVANTDGVDVKKLSVSKSNNEVNQINVVVKKENFLFSIQKEVELKFSENLLESYQLHTYQKIILLEPFEYKLYALPVKN